MTLDQLAKLCAKPARWLDPLTAAMLARAITPGNRRTDFLATCLFESNGFLSLSENLNYSARGLLRVWPNRFDIATANDYAGQPERIANRVYANRNGNGDEASGDGFLYRGGGLIQLTGRGNFERAEAATGLPLVDQPELLQTPGPACEVAAWFWAANACNELADEGDFDGTQGIINRGSRNKTAENMKGRNEWRAKVEAALS